jgi:hypothetical protein
MFENNVANFRYEICRPSGVDVIRAKRVVIGLLLHATSGVRSTNRIQSTDSIFEACCLPAGGLGRDLAYVGYSVCGQSYMKDI